MALARYESVAVNLAGDVIPNATVEVRRDQPGRPVVPLFSDRDGTVALGNPITTDSEGKFGFHVPGGVYYIRVFTGPAQQPLQQYVRRYQAIGTAAERDIEDLATALEAGTATFSTLADLEAFVPEGEGIGGKVTTGEDAGFYHYDTAAEEWVFDRPLYDTLARMSVTGGTADAVEASVDDGIAEASVIAFMIKPTETNTAAVTINGKALLNVNGDALSAGEFPAERWITFTDEGANYQMTSDPAVDAILAQAIQLIEDAEQLATPGDGTVSNAKLAPMATATIKGRATAGTGNAEDLTATQATALLNPVVGDVGAGGTKGLVPAPAAGDAAASKFLKADGSWAELRVDEVTPGLLGLHVSEFTEAAVFLGESGNIVADAWVDDAYIDTVNSTGADFTVPGVITPQTGDTGTVASNAGTGANGGWLNSTIVVTIASAQVLLTGTGTVSVTFHAGTTEGLAITEAYIGHAAASGDAFDFEAAPTQLFFPGASASGLCSVGGTAVASASFNIQPGKALVIAYQIGSSASTDEVSYVSVTGWNGYWKTATGDAATVDKTGYSGTSNAMGISDVSIVGETADMTVYLGPFSWDDAQLSSAWLRVKEVDAATINTDYTLRVSRDGKDTWENLTLEGLFTSQSPVSDVLVVGSNTADLSGQTDAGELWFELATHNGKQVDFRGSVFSWRGGEPP